jgi:hypothetical protein
VALKFILHIHFGWFSFGFYAAVVLCVGLVVATLQASRDRPVLQRTSPLS